MNNPNIQTSARPRAYFCASGWNSETKMEKREQFSHSEHNGSFWQREQKNSLSDAVRTQWPAVLAKWVTWEPQNLWQLYQESQRTQKKICARRAAGLHVCWFKRLEIEILIHCMSMALKERVSNCSLVIVAWKTTGSSGGETWAVGIWMTARTFVLYRRFNDFILVRNRGKGQRASPHLCLEQLLSKLTRSFDKSAKKRPRRLSHIFSLPDSHEDGDRAPMLQNGPI